MEARHTFVCDEHWQWEINHTGPKSSAGGQERRANYLYPWKLILDTTDLTAAAESFQIGGEDGRRKGLLLLLLLSVKIQPSTLDLKLALE